MLKFKGVLLALLLAVPGWAVRQEFATPASVDTVVVRVDSPTEQVFFSVGTTPSVATPTTRTVFSAGWSTGSVFNDASRTAVDFRVESDAGDSALVVDAGGDSLFSEVRAHFRGAMYGRSTLNVIGDVGIGVGTTDALGLRILKASANVGISLERTTDVTATASIYVDANGDLSVGPETSDKVSFKTNNTDRANINETGAMFINETANTDLTLGLTINQGVNDNNIMDFKSSDVAHAMTALVEADTYLSVNKNTATGGGALIRAYSDAQLLLGQGTLSIEAIVGVAEIDSTDVSSSQAPLWFRAAQTDGAANVTGLSDLENMAVWRNNTTTRMLLKGSGALHLANTTLVALDNEPDAHLLRAFERWRSADNGILLGKGDALMQAGIADLQRVKVVSSDGSFYDAQRMTALQNGAIWRNYDRLLYHDEWIEVLQRDNLELHQRVVALEQMLQTLSTPGRN